MRIAPALILATLAACAGTGGGRGEDPSIAKGRPKIQLAKAGITGDSDIPAERNGVRLEDTGAILWICANSDKHEDKEVFIEKCAACSRSNYYFYDHSGEQYVCYACLKTVDRSTVKCGECGQPPRNWRTRPKMNKG